MRSTDGELEDSVFISYTHVDNQPFGPEALRWVTHLHEQLANRVGQLVGESVSVWRDDKLQGNDEFAETLVDRLANVAVLVSVCSPRYVRSDWCLLELDEFVRFAARGDGLQLGTKSRVFKVLKTPVPLEEMPQPLVPLLGYEFYEHSVAGDRIREFLLNPDPEERWKFYARVDDLAQDIAELLRQLVPPDARRTTPIPRDGQLVYLAQTTLDAMPYRDNVKRELERRGHRVLPAGPLPLAADELIASVADDLARADISIHLLGARYGAVLTRDNSERSIPQLQIDLAESRGSQDGFTALIWVPEGLGDIEEAQSSFIEGLRTADHGRRVELVEAPLETFKAYALECMAQPPAPAVNPEPRGEGQRVYLVSTPNDRVATAAIQARLEAEGHIVVLPLSEGSEAEAREVHEEELVIADAVLIYYGVASEHWVRMKLLDLAKARGWGRARPFRAKAVLIGSPLTPGKSNYRTSEALVLEMADGPTTLDRFLAQLAGSDVQ